jgi:hypothetical protein
MKLLKLRKLFAKESLCRARKRIRNDLKQSANSLIYNYIFNQGADGYFRDRNCYGK